MTEHVQQLTVTDPDNVQEIFCDGQLNVSIGNGFATLTFSHVRAEPMAMFKDGTVTPKAVVRARIVVTLANLAALRDLLNRLVETPEMTPPRPGGPARH